MERTRVCTRRWRTGSALRKPKSLAASIDASLLSRSESAIRLHDRRIERDPVTELAAAFEEHRSHLRGVAFRMLGSASEADDAVQNAWLKVTRADTTAVENLRG